MNLSGCQVQKTAVMATNDTVTNSQISLYSDDESLDISNGRVDDVQANLNVKFAVVVMLSVFSFVGVIGNAIAFYIFFGRRSTSTSIIFILALAGTDCFTCLVTIPYTIVFELLHYNLVYDLACKAYMFLITSTVPFSAYIMVGIALDRYFCICHPFLHLFTKPRAKTVILFMSIPALIFGTITALSHGTYVYEWDIRPNSSNNTEAQHFTVSLTHQSDVDRLLALNNMTNVRTQRNKVPYHMCVNNTFIFSEKFLEVYEKIHALNFLLAYVSVAVLYILIYRSIFIRRVKKAKRKRRNLYPSAGNKKTHHQEETQMTAVNGGTLNSPKVLNNQTRKDGKCARKITLTARNYPTAFRKSYCQKMSRTARSNVQTENGLKILTKDQDSIGNIVNGIARSLDMPKKSLTYCESIPAGDYIDNDSNVYIGRRVNSEINSVCPHNRSGENYVYTSPQQSSKNGSVYAEAHPSQGDNSVHIGPQLRQDEKCVETEPQSSQENNSVSTGPHQTQYENRVYIDPQCSNEKSGPYTGPHFSPKHSKLIIVAKDNSEEDEKEAVTDTCISTSITPSKEHNMMLENVTKVSLGKSQIHEQTDDAATTAVYYAKQSSLEEKTLLPKFQEFPSTSTTLQPRSSKFSSQETDFTTDIELRKHLQAKQTETDSQTNGVKRKRQGTIRDRHLMANIKTAFMLFIVTVVFILAFLPALLMANNLIQLNLIAFYGYFIYNVVNPFIYAFMNQTFREDLKKLMSVCQQRES